MFTERLRDAADNFDRLPLNGIGKGGLRPRNSATNGLTIPAPATAAWFVRRGKPTLVR
jgi:hypothetical protein